MTNQNINKEELLKFIAKAHRNTYAAPSEIKKQSKMQTPFLPGHKCYEFKDGLWQYFDGYAGSQWAPGREVVLFEGNPVWAMAYQGKTIEGYSTDFLENRVFPFLKKALTNMEDSMPFRGPRLFIENDFMYKFEMDGDYDYFTGKETIDHMGERIFFQDVMGESIK